MGPEFSLSWNFLNDPTLTPHWPHPRHTGGGFRQIGKESIPVGGTRAEGLSAEQRASDFFLSTSSLALADARAAFILDRRGRGAMK